MDSNAFLKDSKTFQFQLIIFNFFSLLWKLAMKLIFNQFLSMELQCGYNRRAVLFKFSDADENQNFWHLIWIFRRKLCSRRICFVSDHRLDLVSSTVSLSHPNSLYVFPKFLFTKSNRERMPKKRFFGQHFPKSAQKRLFWPGFFQSFARGAKNVSKSGGIFYCFKRARKVNLVELEK